MKKWFLLVLGLTFLSPLGCAKNGAQKTTTTQNVMYDQFGNPIGPQSMQQRRKEERRRERMQNVMYTR
jgi:hypothetical protein